MPFKYKPCDSYDAPFDPERCAASVPLSDRSVSFRQCLRRAVKDGWCKQHHPDAELARTKEAAERYMKQRDESPIMRLARCQQNVRDLQDEIARLRAALEAVEWIEEDYDPVAADWYCPWCDEYKDAGHAADCQRQAALKEGR